MAIDPSYEPTARFYDAAYAAMPSLGPDAQFLPSMAAQCVGSLALRGTARHSSCRLRCVTWRTHPPTAGGPRWKHASRSRCAGSGATSSSTCCTARASRKSTCSATSIAARFATTRQRSSSWRVSPEGLQDDVLGADSATAFICASPFSNCPPIILSMFMTRWMALAMKLFRPSMLHVTTV